MDKQDATTMSFATAIARLEARFDSLIVTQQNNHVTMVQQLAVLASRQSINDEHLSAIDRRIDDVSRTEVEISKDWQAAVNGIGVRVSRLEVDLRSKVDRSWFTTGWRALLGVSTIIGVLATVFKLYVPGV